MVKKKDYFSKIRNARVPALATSIELSPGSPAQSSLSRKRKKSHPNQKGRNKIISVCIWRWSYTKKTLNSIKTITINELSEVAEYRINIQKLFRILYFNDELFEKENSLIYSIKNNKIPRNKFNRESERSVLQKLRHWSKKLTKTWIKGKIFHAHGSRE